MELFSTITAYQAEILLAGMGLIFILQLFLLQRTNSLRKRQKRLETLLSDGLNRIDQNQKEMKESMGKEAHSRAAEEKRVQKQQEELPEKLIQDVLSEVFS
mgnify:FL=1